MLYIVLRKTNRKIYEIKAENILNEKHERHFSDREWRNNQSQYVFLWKKKTELETSLQRILRSEKCKKLTISHLLLL